MATVLVNNCIKMADDVDNFNNFTQLSSKITQLLHGKSLNNRNLIKKTIDELSSINYRYPVIKNPTKAVLLINQCCTLIPPEDQQLVVGFCKLLKVLINLQNIQIEGRTLMLTINWCLEALKFNGNNSEFEIISSLDCLLRMDKKHEALKDIVNNSKLIDNLTKTDLDIVLITMKCFEAAILPTLDQKKPLNDDYSDEEFSNCFNIFLKQLIDYKNIENPKMIKILTVCLLGLQHITVQKPTIINQNLSIIFGIIRSYICFGIVGINFINPEKVLPTTLTIPEPVSYVADKKSGKAIKRRKQRNPAVDKKQNFNDFNENDNNNDNNNYRPININNDEQHNNNMIKTSDSDYSQSDVENGENLTKLTMKLRQTALGLFIDVIKVGQKGVIFTYLSTFIPENSSTTINKHSLINCILKDPTSKGRLAALNTLLLLLTTSRLYLKQAEKGENISFTPFSVVIGNMLNELHKCLIMSLNEQYIPVLVQILKCFSALIQATPYHKLQTGLITTVIQNIKPLIYHRDSSVQVTSLIVLGYCLSIEPILLEIQDILIDNNNNDDNDDNNSLIRRKSWLIERCLLNLGIENQKIINNNLPTTVKMESLQILSIIIRHYYHLFLLSYIESINLCLLLTINDKYLDVRYHTLRTIDSICQTINLKLFNNNGNIGDDNNCVIIQEKMLHLWLELLQKPLIDCIQSEQYPNLRTASCDCLGSIGSVIFEKLPRDKQILCITLLFNCTYDQDDCVRSTCVRTLGLLILYPIIRDDYGFIMDTIGIFLNLLNDKNLSVRIKTSWSLANLCEALVLNKLDLNTNEEFPKKLLLKLLKSINLIINDNDRIKMNIVRAIGSLLQLITFDLINNNDEFIIEIQQNIDNLVRCCSTGSNMKVRWNSCYALKNMMKNPILFKTNFNWQENVFNTLIDLAMNFRNFKVRICATSALSSPNQRLYYDQYFIKIWNGLCKALENAENMEDFSEYNHRDHLVDEICLTIGHLITLLTIDDLSLIHECINLNYENLKRQIQKVWDRLLPEKITILFNANQHLNDLLSIIEDKKKIDQKYVVKQLQEIIKQEF